MDIALLAADTDYYHLECQMHKDTQMVLRMITKEKLTVFVSMACEPEARQAVLSK